MTNQTTSNTNSYTVDQRSYQHVCPTKCEDNTNTNTNINKDNNPNEDNSSGSTKFASIIVQDVGVKNPTDKQFKQPKKKKKKKKLSAYKKLLKSAKQSKYTEKERAEIDRANIKKSLGGGRFSKHDFI